MPAPSLLPGCVVVKPLRIVFMGTPEFSVPSLEKLASGGHHVVAVVTKPDKPAGRGRAIQPPPVKRAAERLGLPVIQPPSLRDTDTHSRLEALQPDLFVVVAFRVLPEELLRIPRLGAINLHASLLPKYRGAAPIQRALINGERETGVTVFLLEPTVDTGRILRQRPIAIGDDETCGELAARLSVTGAEELAAAVDDLARGTAVMISQDDAEATTAPKLTKEDGRIRWNERAEAIRNRVRALNPSPGAYALWKGQPFGILRAAVEEAPAPGDEAPGTILQADDRHGVRVATGDGILRLDIVQPAGRRPMEGAAWVRGAHPQKGERFE